MRLSQQIEIIAEVKKEAEVKKGARERVEIGVSVYLGKDKLTNKDHSQWYTCMTFDQSYGDLLLNRCPLDSIVKIIGDVKYKIGTSKRDGQAVYGTVFIKHAEYIGMSERKVKSNYTKAAPVINDGLFTNPNDDVPF